MKQIIKKVTQKALGSLGYQLVRKNQLPLDAFRLQGKLINTREPVIFDVGAHKGSVAKIYRDQFPEAAIHCFEPFPDSFNELLNTTNGDSRTLCYKTSLSDKKGVVVLNSNLSSATNSLLPTDNRGAAYWGDSLLDTTAAIEVPTTTLDIFCLETGISSIDILKMDVQGAEYSVLMGSRDMLKNKGISLIYAEFILCPTYEGQHKLHEYLSLLDSLDYQLLDFFNPVRSHNQLIQADLMFLKSSLMEIL